MCERFSVDISREQLASSFGISQKEALPSRCVVTHGHLVPVVRQSADGQNCLVHLRWGLVPSWSKEASRACPMITTRSESVSEPPASKEAAAYRRCLVLASGFYECKERGPLKRHYHFRLKNNKPMVFAGLWDSWKSPDGVNLESCSILTTAANHLLSGFNRRMPVILHPDEYLPWLDRKTCEVSGLLPFFHPYPSDLMETWPPVTAGCDHHPGAQPDPSTETPFTAYCRSATNSPDSFPGNELTGPRQRRTA